LHYSAGKSAPFEEFHVFSELPIPREFGTEQNFARKRFLKFIRVFFFVLEWFGTSFQRFLLLLSLIVQNEIPSVFLFCELFYLPWNSELFRFRETDGIPTE
jgi:hypothetical protein